MTKIASRRTLICLIAALTEFWLVPIATAQTLEQAKTHMRLGQHDKAALELVALAKGGDSEAQRLLGEMIYKGQGFDVNAEAAFMWTELASKNGDYIAQFNLGYMYEQGAGTALSAKEAKKWYERSASNGYALAQKRLGDMHAETDKPTAIYWYNQARMNGDASVLEVLSKLDAHEDKLREMQIAAEHHRNQIRAERAAGEERERARRKSQAFAAALGQNAEAISNASSSANAALGLPDEQSASSDKDFVKLTATDAPTRPKSLPTSPVYRGPRAGTIPSIPVIDPRAPGKNSGITKTARTISR